MAREGEERRQHMAQRPSGYFESKSLTYRAWAVIGCVILFGAAIWAIGMLGSTLELLLVGVLVGYLCSAMTNWFEDHGISRGLGAFLALVIFVLALIALFAIILPPFFEQLMVLLRNVPTYFSQLRTSINQLWEFLGERADPDLQATVSDIITAASDSFSEMSTSAISSVSGGILPVIGGTVSNVVMFFLGLVLAYWLARDYPVLFREISVIVGPNHRDELTFLMAVMSRSVGGYMRGTLVTSLVSGVLTWVGLLLAGHPYAGLMGILAGVLHIIPVIGPWVAAATAVVAVVFDSPILALWTLIITVVAQNVTSNLVSPLVMQSAVKVHPILSLVAIVMGSALGGVIGAILAIPLSAAIKSGFVYYFESRTGRQLVSYDGALFRGTPYHTTEGEIMPSFDALDDDKFFESTRLVPSQDVPVVQADERPETMQETVTDLLTRRLGEIKFLGDDEETARSTKLKRAQSAAARRKQND